jgi:hypothetical protein
MYESLILLDPETNITSQQLADELRAFYEGKVGAPASITLVGDGVSLVWPDYSLTVHRSSLEHVVEESAEIAQEFGAGHPARDRIALCVTRFEMSGADDPNLDYMNDALFVGEALERLGRVYRFDTQECEFLS